MTTQYRVHVDTADNGTFATPIITDVLEMRWRLGMTNPDDLVAATSTATLTLRNPTRTYSPEYNAMLQTGRRVRIQSVTPTINSGQPITHFVGYIRKVEPAPGELGERTTTLHLTGPEPEYAQVKITLPLQIKVRVNQVLDAAFNIAPLTRFTRSFEVGISKLSYVGDLWGDGVSAARVIQELVEAERGRFFYSRDGVVTCYNRHHLDTTPTISATFDDHAVKLTYAYGAEAINSVRVRLRPRSIGANGTTLWTLNTPQLLRPNIPREIVAVFRDGGGRRIGALSVIPPVASTDFTANTASDGSGSDQTAWVTMTILETSAGAVKLRLLNQSVVSVHLQAGSKVRGKPIYPGDSALVEAKDESAQMQYGIQMLNLSLPALDDIDEAAQLADYELARRVTPRGLVRTLTLDERNRFDNALRLTLFDRLRIIETQTDHTGDYVIVAEEHHVYAGGLRHRVTWTLESVPNAGYWVLNQTALGGGMSCMGY